MFTSTSKADSVLRKKKSLLLKEKFIFFGVDPTENGGNMKISCFLPKIYLFSSKK